MEIDGITPDGLSIHLETRITQLHRLAQRCSGGATWAEVKRRQERREFLKDIERGLAALYDAGARTVTLADHDKIVEVSALRRQLRRNGMMQDRLAAQFDKLLLPSPST